MSLTDSNSPVLGPYVRAIVRAAGVDPAKLVTNSDERNVSYATVLTERSGGRHYPNEYCDDFGETFDQAFPGFDHVSFKRFLREATTLGALMRPPPMSSQEPPTVPPTSVAVDTALAPCAEANPSAAPPRPRRPSPAALKALARAIARESDKSESVQGE
jgi:hypothetical protein